MTLPENNDGGSHRQASVENNRGYLFFDDGIALGIALALAYYQTNDAQGNKQKETGDDTGEKKISDVYRNVL